MMTMDWLRVYLAGELSFRTCSSENMILKAEPVSLKPAEVELSSSFLFLSGLFLVPLISATDSTTQRTSAVTEGADINQMFHFISEGLVL